MAEFLQGIDPGDDNNHVGPNSEPTGYSIVVPRVKDSPSGKELEPRLPIATVVAQVKAGYRAIAWEAFWLGIICGALVMAALQNLIVPWLLK